MFNGTWNLKTPPNIRYALNPRLYAGGPGELDGERAAGRSWRALHLRCRRACRG